MLSMERETHTCEQLIIYGLALALAIAVAFTPGNARSGAYESHPQADKPPRWSNDRHHEQGLIVRTDCVALPPGASAEYVPGRDAWGRPVVPAEPPKGFNDSFPVGVDLDINLGTKHVGGKDIEMHGGYLQFDPSTNELSLNGRTWQRDCLPSQK
jgi:hypothetical protein